MINPNKNVCGFDSWAPARWGGGITDVEGAGERQPSHHHADAQLTFHRKHLSTFNFLMWLFLS